MKINFRKLSQEEQLVECRKPYAPKTRPHKNKKKYRRKNKLDDDV